MLMMMEKVNQKRGHWSSCCLMGWFGIMLLLLTESAAKKQNIITNEDSGDQESSYPPVKLYTEENQVVMDNGLVNITLSVPEGDVLGIEYNGIQNLLLQRNELDNRGYWDIVWQYPGHDNNFSENHISEIFDKLPGTNFRVIKEDEDQVELSFTIAFDDNSGDKTQLPLNIDKRFVLLRGSSGFYTYAIFERLEGWPDVDLAQSRTVFKLDQNLFIYMAISDEKQRIMPTNEDREKGQPLAYPEAVLLTNPSNSFLRGEVDDKYQYSCNNEHCWAHGWICAIPPTGFWMITPSIEFKTGGPVKQDLTSHVGPTVLSMFFSTHYGGGHLMVSFRNEPWKKVFGPVFVYVNSVSDGDDPLDLWADAKEQMLLQKESWPYNFLSSEDYPLARQRGTVSGRLLVQDSYIIGSLITGNSAYVGLAAPGDAGSWQMENKGYQFWTQADKEGYFVIKNVRPGNYSLYAWVPGFIGDYKYENFINIGPGRSKRLGNVIYRPPRNGPTLWEIGIPDRTALEFFVPDPNPKLMNQLYSLEQAEKYRQYGLWDRYTELYPVEDLVFTVGVNNYQTDWFFAHVNRKDGNTYIPTTWKIIFDLQDIDPSGTYMLQLALAAACEAELQVRTNNPDPMAPHFTTHLIGKDNSIARHGIHGLYWLYSIQIPGTQLQMGTNTLFLTQSRGGTTGWKGVMYDYIRLEGPSSIS